MHFLRRTFPLLLLLLAACGTPVQGSAGPVDATTATGDANDSADLAEDVSAAADASATTDTAADGVVKGDFVWLTFALDDSANQTFGDGDIQWTGSFAWDETTNSVTYATSWLPTDGPFVPLYDDGPQPQGHEKATGVKGDHIFSNQVKFVAQKDTLFEYGALNEFSNWMWVGPNGTFTIQAGQGGTFDVPGMKLQKFGKIDAKITLDTKALNKAFATWNPKDFKIFLKGTLNEWTPVQLLDDGQKGDDKADDGVLTYVLQQNLGKHDGLLNENEEVQFTFVATQGDTAPVDGLEYKQGGNGLPDGVAAWTATGAGGAWVAAPVILSKDSKGKTLNTAFVVTVSAPPACLPACASGEDCVGGKCVAKTCIPACQNGQTCISGVCQGAVVTATFTGIEPKWTAAKGGGTVTLLGENLSTAFEVLFTSSADATQNGKGQNPQLVNGKGISVTVPQLPPVFADVSVTPTGQPPIVLKGALDVVPIDTPQVDGVLSSDWNAMSLAALNDVLSNWNDAIDTSKINELSQLWVAYDASNLYVGLQGSVEKQNAIVCYLDVDFGGGTGSSSPSSITDSSGAVDNALGNLLSSDNSSIGLDFAFATVGMGSFAGGDLGGSTSAGWRGLSNLSDLAWLQGVVLTSGKSVEASIALSVLYPGGIPDGGSLLKIACGISNKDGSAVSNQSLPPQVSASSPGSLASWWNVRIYPVSP